MDGTRRRPLRGVNWWMIFRGRGEGSGTCGDVVWYEWERG